MEIPNPPLPPPPTPPQPALQVPQSPFTAATVGQRFGNFFIDAVIVNIIQSLFGFTEIYELVGIHPFFSSIIISIVYYAGLESLNGKTLGKYVTGTRVVALDGSEITFNHAALRTIIRYVPFEPLSFLGGGRPSGWHDKWSKTLVVEDK